MTTPTETPWSMRAANAALHALHLSVIVFSVFGWMSPVTRPFHLALAGGIAVSWFILGPLIGHPGFCAITGIQHALWRKRGVVDPPNYMTYLAQKVTGKAPDAGRVACTTQWVFYGTTALSILLTVL